MSAQVAHICRYPVKSIGGEQLDRVTVRAGAPLPGDRRFGVIHEQARRHLQDGELHKWLPKSALLRGAAAPALAAVRGGWVGDRLRLTHPDLPPIEVDPEGDDAPLIAWLAPLWSDSGKAPAAALVEGPFPLTDVKKPFVSLLSLASLRQLQADLGQPIDLHRWRANLWVDGWEPQAERDLLGKVIRIGGVRAKVREPIDRCPQTSADGDTGRFQLDMPAALNRLHGHVDFGVYVELLDDGEIATGDPVTLA